MRRIAIIAATISVLAAAPGAAAAAPLLTVSPAPANLRDGQVLRVSGSGFASRAAIVVVQCGAQAASGGPDFCNQRFVAVAPASAAGTFTARFRVHPVIETASGTIDCRATVCLLGAENLGQRSQLGVSGLQFAPGSPAPRRRHPTAARMPSIPRSALAAARPGAPALLRVNAPLAGDIAGGRVGAIATTPSRALPRPAVRGEGLLELTMSAPRTSWRSARATSVVVQVSVDRGHPQEMVLFAGARPFTYEGFTGPLRTGRHRVRIAVRRDLSLSGRWVPTAAIERVRLLVVGPRNPGYRALAYAPVLYDRSVVNHSDTPMLTYATATRLPDGAQRLSYVVIWSNEDAGTGFVPFLLWGGWGRMSDIESAISLTVDRAGHVRNPTYLACATCGAGFPENRTALDETDTSFHGRYFGHHPILRVSTGNNDFSDQGTTPFRFQQALAAAPARGQTREGAMDRNPWSYAITDAEVHRERADFSTDPFSPAPGDVRQYLVIALDTVANHVDAIGVDVRLKGDSHLYSNDFGTTYPLYTGGAGRTVIKVPLKESGRPIAALRLRLQPSAPAPAIRLRCIRVLQYAHGVIVGRRVARVSIVAPGAAPARATPAGCPARR